jgi:hypothetical protein
MTERNPRSRAWSRVGWCLGAVEVVVGGMLCVRGLRYGWAAGDSLSNAWGSIVIFTGLFGFLVPGALLFLKSPARWIAQLIPLVTMALGSTVVAQGLGFR